MSVTINTTAPHSDRRTSATSSTMSASSSSLGRTTVFVGAGAAAVTTAAAALLRAAGAPFEIDGTTIPLLGFAQMMFVGVLTGGLILAGLNRWSNRARHRFVQATAALTAMSCIPSIAMPDHFASQLALVALHVVPAAIIIPLLARHART